jgi:hypothetical protein
MLKHTAFVLFVAWAGICRYTVEEHLDQVSKVKCTTQVPKNFVCAILFYVDPAIREGIDVAGVIGAEGKSNFVNAPVLPVIREVALILDGTLYTAVYDPPLPRDDKFFGLRRNVGIPARVDGDNLLVKWPDGKEATAKIIRREKINPNRPQPA